MLGASLCITLAFVHGPLALLLSDPAADTNSPPFTLPFCWTVPQDLGTLEQRLQAVARRMVARSPNQQGAAAQGQAAAAAGNGQAATMQQRMPSGAIPQGHVPVNGAVPGASAAQQQQASGAAQGPGQGAGMMPTPGQQQVPGAYGAAAGQQAAYAPQGAGGGQAPHGYPKGMVPQHQAAQQQQQQQQQAMQQAAGGGPQPIDQRAVKIQQQRALVQKQQRWLLFLRHASKCQAPEGKCPVTPHCGVARKLWHHVLACREPKCEYPRCVPSRELLSHHQRCREPRCVVCAPVREALQRRQQAQANEMKLRQMQQMQAQGHLPQGARGHGQVAVNAYGQPVVGPDGQMMMVPQQQMVLQQQEAKPATGRPPKRRKKEPTGKEEQSVQQFAQAAAQQQQAGLAAGTGLTVKGRQGTAAAAANGLATSVVDTFPAEDIDQHMRSLRAEREEREKRDMKANGGAGKPAPPKLQLAPGVINENMCHLCLSERLTFEPPPLYCSTCAQRVKRAQQYWTPAHKMQDPMGQVVRYVWCGPCIKAQANGPELPDGRVIPKNQLVKRTNNEDQEEPWVQCDKCNRWQHQVCALFNDASNRQADGDAAYTCPVCRLDALRKAEGTGKSKKGQAAAAKLLKEAGKWSTAADLPRTTLSDYLEGRMKRALDSDREARAAKAGLPVEQLPAAEPLTIRMISNVAKQFEVKSKFQEWYPEMASDVPKGQEKHILPYQSKVLLLFQKIEGMDVVIFAAYLQEYGANCPEPNRRRVYLSYLDSVKFFRPNIQTAKGESLRTMVYQELLCGYLDFVKRQGYVHMYIWACPPVSGEDYILYCHPDHQKVPKHKALREWYLRMLVKSKDEGVVLSVGNLYDLYLGGNVGRQQARPCELPYYEGDYLPGAAEELILKIEKEDQEAAEAAMRGRGGKKGGSKKRAGELAVAGAAGFGTRRGVAGAMPTSEVRDQKLISTIAETIKSMKEDFILVHLAPLCHCCRKYQTKGNIFTFYPTKKDEVTLCGECHEREGALEPKERYGYSKGFWKADGTCMATARVVEGIVDEPKPEPDKAMTSDFFDSRQQYLSLCQGNHYQFDELRRAKHSSMMTLFHLHNPDVEAFVANCNSCGVEIEPGGGFRCTQCTDYDLCAACHSLGRHPHRMVANSQGGREEERLRRERMLAHMQRTMQLLVHASACRLPNCASQNCNKVKALFHHGVNCQVRVTGGCQTCKRMWALLHLHARQCQSAQCPVPRCRDLKATVRRAQQQQEDRRRAAVLAHYRQQQ